MRIKVLSEEGCEYFEVNAEFVPRVGDKLAIDEIWEDENGKKHRTPAWAAVTEIVYLREGNGLACHIYISQRDIDEAIALEEKVIRHSQKMRAVRELI